MTRLMIRAMSLQEDQSQKNKQDFIKHIEKLQGLFNIDDIMRARNEKKKLEFERERRLSRY